MPFLMARWCFNINSKRLKNALKTDRTLLWAWQMVFPIVTDLKKRASWLMQLLSQIESLSRQTIYDLQSSLSEELAEDYFGSATTFVAAEIDQITRKAKILSVGDSRAYLIDTKGNWQQITQDHSILSELLSDFPR